MRSTSILALFLYCMFGQAQAQSCPPPPTLDAKQVVAQWGKTQITLSDIDGHLGQALCRAQMEYHRKLDTLRRAALEDAVDQRLLAEEAKKAKLANGQALLEKVIVEKLVPPSDAQIKGFYDENKDRMQGANFEQVQEQISAYLLQAAGMAARDAYLSGLRHAAKVKLSLPPFRLTVRADGPSRGPVDAPVVIVSFADYECPYCGQGARTLKTLQSRYPKKVRIVFKDFPLDFHPQAVPAAVAARCAGQQKKYGAMHDLLFERPGFTEAKFRSYATELGLDDAQFAQCLKDPKMAEGVDADRKQGEALGVDGTPAFFVNGILLTGSQPMESFVQIIESELARQP